MLWSKASLFWQKPRNAFPSILTEELRFLKALQSNGLTPSSQDFFPVLRHAIQDLLELRFREKKIRVEINGQPLARTLRPLGI